MATTVQIGGDGNLFVGEDKDFETVVSTVAGVPVDISGWDIRFDVRKSDKAADPAIFSKTGTVAGTYNVDPLVNTQYVFVSLTDTEMNTVKASTLRYSWKRMNDSVETVLSRGDFVVEKATAP